MRPPGSWNMFVGPGPQEAYIAVSDSRAGLLPLDTAGAMSVCGVC